MVSVTEYDERRENGRIIIESREACLCPDCGSPMRYRDRVQRWCRNGDGSRECYLIARLKCLNSRCGRIHRQLTRHMVAFKQYSAEMIEDVLDGILTEEDTLENPCPGTFQGFDRH